MEKRWRAAVAEAFGVALMVMGPNQQFWWWLLLSPELQLREIQNVERGPGRRSEVDPVG